ncbi:B3 DNA binding domain, partial [Dillenia turbinata]
CVPPAFLRHFGGIVPKKVIFKDMKKKLYNVYVEKVKRDFYFLDGWEEFVNDQPIELGDFLVFKYNRHAAFDVKIFGTNGCKKKLSVDSEKPSQSEEAVDGTSRLKVNELVPMEKANIFEETEVVSISDGEGKEDEKEEEEKAIEKLKEVKEEDDDDDEEQGLRVNKRTFVLKRKFNPTLFSDDVCRVKGATIRFLSSIVPIRTSSLARLLVTDDHQSAEGPWVHPTCQNARSMKAAAITDEQYKLLREAGIVIPRCPHFLASNYANKRKYQLTIPKYLIQKHNIGMNRDIVFRDENGKHWPTQIQFGADGRTKVTYGWRRFCEEHNLCSNDKCLLELVISSENRCSEIRAQIFHARAVP